MTRTALAIMLLLVLGIAAAGWVYLGRTAVAHPATPQPAMPGPTPGQVFQMKGCSSCHTVDGAANIGPTLKGIYGTQLRFTDGTSRIADDAHLAHAILDHSAEIAEGFPNVGLNYRGRLTDQEVQILVGYIRTLSPNAPRADAR